jgi:hypothetical protein
MAVGTSTTPCAPSPFQIENNDGGAGAASIEDLVFGAAWNGDTDGASKNALFDYFNLFDTDNDGEINVLDTDAVDAITEIAAALKSGADGTLITGTAGTDTHTAVWNADGDLVDGYDPTTKQDVLAEGAFADGDKTNIDALSGGAYSQEIFVTSAGDDGNDGLSPATPKLTIGSAITAASALMPASDNVIVISGDDAAEYTEDITVPRYVFINMPNAHLIGGVTSTSPDAGVRFRQITKLTSGNAVFLNSAIDGQFWVDVEKIVIDGTANGLACAQDGALIAHVQTIENGGTNHAIVGLTTQPGHIHAEVEDIYLTSTGYAVGLAVGGTVHVHVKHILNEGAGAGTAVNADAGTIYLSANHIDVTSAWDVESGATLYIDCDVIDESGSSANAGTVVDWKSDISTMAGSGAQDVSTSANPSFNSVHASGGNLAAANAQVTKKWITGLDYTADVTSVIHGGVHYICTSTHTAGATTEPGVGVDWATVWSVSGSDNLGSAASSDVIALWASGSCSGYLKSDGTCDTPAGAGDVSATGTPAQYEWGVWTDATTLSGVAVTGSKVACTDANGSPVACTTLEDVAYEPADATILKEADVSSTAADGQTTSPMSADWAYKIESEDMMIGGIKTFSSYPLGPATDPTSDLQLVTKGYVDANITNYKFNDIGDADGAATIDLGAYQHLMSLSATDSEISFGTPTDHFRIYRDSNGNIIWTIVDGENDGNIFMQFNQVFDLASLVAATTDGQVSGQELNVTVDSGETNTAIGQVMAEMSDGEYEAADLDDQTAAAYRKPAGLLKADATGANSIVTKGLIYNATDWDWTAGAELYLSTDPTTTSGITETMPVQNPVWVIGRAESADAIMVNIHETNPWHYTHQPFDPVTVGALTNKRLPIAFSVGQMAPNGMIIGQWGLSFDADPTTELAGDLKYADDFVSAANSAVIDVLDTTAGVSYETTASNINGGSAIASDKTLYIQLDNAYAETGHAVIFSYLWRAVK